MVTQGGHGAGGAGFVTDGNGDKRAATTDGFGVIFGVVFGNAEVDERGSNPASERTCGRADGRTSRAAQESREGASRDDRADAGDGDGGEAEDEASQATDQRAKARAFSPFHVV